MPNHIGETALRRLMRAHARVEGAQQALQAADGVYRALASNFEDALRGAAEDASVDMPPPGSPAQIHIDWNTGEVSWSEQQPGNGLVAQLPTEMAG